MLVCQKVVALQRTVVATQSRVPEQKSLQDASGLHAENWEAKHRERFFDCAVQHRERVPSGKLT